MRPRELAEIDRQLTALRAWWQAPGDEKAKLVAARKAARCRSIAETKILVSRGQERYVRERLEHLAMIQARQGIDLEHMRDGLADGAFEGDVYKVDRMLKLQEREAKLWGSDAQKDVGVQVGTFVLTGNARIEDVPEGATVIDTRLPWEREGGEDDERSDTPRGDG